MPLPAFLQAYLPSYDIKKLDKASPGVAREVITQVLNSGDDKAVAWVFENYTLKQIREAVKHPQRGVWFKNSLNYWTKILKVDVDTDLYRKAIFNLNPFDEAPRANARGIFSPLLRRERNPSEAPLSGAKGDKDYV